MPRVKRGTVRRAARKKLSKLTKGHFLNKSKLYRYMKESADRAGRFAYRDRRRRKRDFRRLWILRINAAARQNDLTYSQFMNGLKKMGSLLDRKSLAEIAARDAVAFAALAAEVKAALAANPS
ncbi:MAG TPA: 50S ribosomal protein L20 [Terriglobia bacterium]|nr:50S ribosomal protein L20 [Terriglobia bacterium]